MAAPEYKNISRAKRRAQNIVVNCHRDKSGARRRHLSVALSPPPACVNIRRRPGRPSEEDRICLLHQIETVSGYQPRVCVPTLAYRSDAAPQRNAGVLLPEGWEDSSNAAMLLRLLASFQLHHANSTIIPHQISSVAALVQCLRSIFFPSLQQC